MLTRSPQDDIITPGTSTVAKFMAVTSFEISHVSECQMNHALSKRLQYVWTTFPTHCPLRTALPYCDSAILGTAWAALCVVVKEHVFL